MNNEHAIAAPGILLLYHRPALLNDASTVVDNIEAFAKYSAYKVWSLNTEYGFPRKLSEIKFPVIVLHYSLFGGQHYYMNNDFLDYLHKSKAAYKIAFFQDEYRYCQKRFGFINHYGIDCVYTLLEPEYFDAVYKKYTSAYRVITHIPGYVSEGLIEAARKFGIPDSERTVDIGYRGRPLDFYMGKGAQEKTGVAAGFLQRAAGTNLKLDIEQAEDKRIYGDAWYRFTAHCRGFLGVEAGVSIFDLQDTVRIHCEKRLKENSGITFEALHDEFLYKWEDRIPYRTISPRHFEAAAFRVCQILFQGKYSGILKPMVHYIPLKKDFSNFNEVMQLFLDQTVRHELTENAYRDLIASGKYSYSKFVKQFDTELPNIGLQARESVDASHINALLMKGAFVRKMRSTVLAVRYHGRWLPLSIRRILKRSVPSLLYGNTDYNADKKGQN
ncbi:MAG TPA: hypothetical protein VFS39_05830 [Nitrospira sp.]|nr:hypothetical protein [Nitrospira sp.]